MLRFRRLRARTPGIDELIPAKHALPPYTHKGDFKTAGARFLHAAVDAGLEPHHVLLDLGCGVGRLAVAFSQYLDDRGRYVGLDTDHKAITVCNEWIGSKLPQIGGSDLDKASAAALEYTGGGQVTDTEVGDEESYYEVEVSRDDGSQVDVQLDRSFHVVGGQTDEE